MRDHKINEYPARAGMSKNHSLWLEIVNVGKNAAIIPSHNPVRS
jgi:hypothetical protein